METISLLQVIGLQNTNDILANVLRQAEAQVWQILSWVPVDEKGDTSLNRQCIKHIHGPLVSIDVSCSTLGELDKTIY